MHVFEDVFIESNDVDEWNEDSIDCRAASETSGLDAACLSNWSRLLYALDNELLSGLLEEANRFGWWFGVLEPKSSYFYHEYSYFFVKKIFFINWLFAISLIGIVPLVVIVRCCLLFLNCWPSFFLAVVVLSLANDSPLLKLVNSFNNAWANFCPSWSFGLNPGFLVKFILSRVWPALVVVLAAATVVVELFDPGIDDTEGIFT